MINKIHILLLILLLASIVIPIVGYIDFILAGGIGLSIYLASIFIAWTGSLIIWNKLFTKKSFLTLFVIMYSMVYFLDYYSIYIYEFFLEKALYKFDINGDFIFSIDEQIYQQQEYMKLFIQDTGRRMYYIFGLFSSFVVSAIMFFVTYVFLNSIYKIQSIR